MRNGHAQSRRFRRVRSELAHQLVAWIIREERIREPSGAGWETCPTCHEYPGSAFASQLRPGWGRPHVHMGLSIIRQQKFVPAG